MIETFDFIAADTHFGHAKILEYGRKGFANVDDSDFDFSDWGDD